MIKMFFVFVVGFVFCWVFVIMVDFFNVIMGIGSFFWVVYVIYILFVYFSSCINLIVCLMFNGRIC